MQYCIGGRGWWICGKYRHPGRCAISDINMLYFMVHTGIQTGGCTALRCSEASNSHEAHQIMQNTPVFYTGIQEYSWSSS